MKMIRDLFVFLAGLILFVAGAQMTGYLIFGSIEGDVYLWEPTLLVIFTQMLLASSYFCITKTGD